jgi:hypothetical protein
LSKLFIIFTECHCPLCTLDTIHRLFFVTRLMINKIIKVQWVDFKLENVLVSLHSLKTMGLGASAPLFLRNGELLGHSLIQIHSSLNSLVLVIISWGSTLDKFFQIYKIFQLNYIIDIAKAYLLKKKGLKVIYFY